MSVVLNFFHDCLISLSMHLDRTWRNSW